MRKIIREHGGIPYPRLFNAGVDSRSRNSAGEDLAIARCPICRHRLVARMRRGGPYFHCGCKRKAA